MQVLNNGKLTISRGNSSSEEEFLNILYLELKDCAIKNSGPCLLFETVYLSFFSIQYTLKILYSIVIL